MAREEVHTNDAPLSDRFDWDLPGALEFEETTTPKKLSEALGSWITGEVDIDED